MPGAPSGLSLNKEAAGKPGGFFVSVVELKLRRDDCDLHIH